MGTHTVSEEYEDFRPCFFESGEEEFYDAPPAPSEDIWKKFELLPTPPRSPKHEPFYQGSILMPSTLDKLRLVSEMLDDPISKTNLVFPDLLCPAKCTDTCCNFNSKLIHDCMWSGHNVPQELKPIGLTTSTTPSPTTPSGSSTSSTCGQSTCRPRTLSLSIETSPCVDPNVAAVFPYPVSTPTDPRQVRETSLGAETPSDSEDSSDSDDDNDEDEEIDVVTVERPVKKAVGRPRGSTTSSVVSRVVSRGVSRPVLPASSSVSAQVAAMHNYTAAAPRSPPPHHTSSRSSHSSPRSSHSLLNHAHKRPRPSGSSSAHHHPLKKSRFTLSASGSSELRTVIHKYQRSRPAQSRCSSDSEDSDGRRAQHNVLERKRRNDLKSSFHRLRDHIPDLQAQERAAKVTILKKASDYIMSLRRQHQTLTTEYDRQKRTHDALQRRLRQLRSK